MKIESIAQYREALMRLNHGPLVAGELHLLRKRVEDYERTAERRVLAAARAWRAVHDIDGHYCCPAQEALMTAVDALPDQEGE